MAHYPRIRDLREDSEKTQGDLAEYLGTTAQYYGLYEKGANELSFERAIRIAKYYNVSLDYIAGRTNSKKGFSKGDLTPEQQELLEFISSLDEKEKASLVKALNLICRAIGK